MKARKPSRNSAHSEGVKKMSRMTDASKDILKEIYARIKSGDHYGLDYTNVRFPFFNNVLGLTWDGKYIYYREYGSTCCKKSLKSLEFIITELFQCSPEQFVARYKLKSESNLA
jgi:hypothetical protein